MQTNRNDSDSYQKAARIIRECDALLITAGAG